MKGLWGKITGYKLAALWQFCLCCCADRQSPVLPGLIFTMNGDDRRSEPVVEYQQQSVCTASAVNLLKVRQSLQADHTESGWLSDQLHHHRGIEKEKDHMLMMTIGPQRLCIVWGGFQFNLH